MTSVESGNEDCNFNVVVHEQPHCILVHLIGLDSIDSLGKTTSLDDDSMTRKPRSRLRWMPAATVKDGRSTQVAPFSEPVAWSRCIPSERHQWVHCLHMICGI